jgi:hypothetical protein
LKRIRGRITLDHAAAVDAFVLRINVGATVVLIDLTPSFDFNSSRKETEETPE